MFQSVFDVHYTLKLVNHNPPLQINFVGMDFHGFFRSICQFTLGIFIHHKLCVLYYIILYYTIIYCIILYYVMFYYSVLYYIVLYFIIFISHEKCVYHTCAMVSRVGLYTNLYILYLHIYII